MRLKSLITDRSTNHTLSIVNPSFLVTRILSHDYLFFILRRETNPGRSGFLTQFVCQNLHLACVPLHDTNAGVSGAKINADDYIMLLTLGYNLLSNFAIFHVILSVSIILKYEKIFDIMSEKNKFT